MCSMPTSLEAQHVTGTVGTQAPPKPNGPVEPRIDVAPGLTSRSPALQDPRFAIKAMGLSAAQEAGLAAVRARYVNAIKGYVARLNALEQSVAQGSASKDNLAATEDTLKAILTAEHTAADSLITPEQKQRYQNAIRQVHAAGVVSPVGVNRSAVRSAARSKSNSSSSSSSSSPSSSPSLVPIP